MMEAASAAEVPIWVTSYLSALRAESLSASCAGYKRQRIALMRCITESLSCPRDKSSLPFLASLVLAPLALVQLVSLTLTLTLKLDRSTRLGHFLTSAQTEY